MEDWKYINDEELYMAHKDGTIYSVKKGKTVPLYYNKHINKMTVRLFIKSVRTTRRVHDIIYRTFKGNFDRSQSIGHKDMNVANNHIDNLYIINRNTSIYKNTHINRNIPILTQGSSEEWKSIPGYEDRYLINKQGIIFSLLKNKLLCHRSYVSKRVSPYEFVTLTDVNSIRKRYPIYKLVDMCFPKYTNVAKYTSILPKICYPSLNFIEQGINLNNDCLSLYTTLFD